MSTSETDLPRNIRQRLDADLLPLASPKVPPAFTQPYEERMAIGRESLVQQGLDSSNLVAGEVVSLASYPSPSPAISLIFASSLFHALDRG